MAEKQFVKGIADINENFTQWYTDVVLKTELVDYGPVKGTMVIRPYGYAIWENIQKDMDKRFKETGSKNAYFPLLIPMSFFTKEAVDISGLNLIYILFLLNTVLSYFFAYKRTLLNAYQQSYVNSVTEDLFAVLKYRDKK